jgi:predicted DsbA family dithiol-disulfide isomerase
LNSSTHEQPAGAGTPLAVEVHFDFVCPWCLIGKRQLDAALRRFRADMPGVRVDIAWRSHQLLPATPVEGIDYQDFYIRRLGSPEAVAVRRMQVREAGRAAGVEFAFDRIRLLPNTARAHDLVARAGLHAPAEQQAALIERIFVAYFLEGQDIGHPDVLKRLGRECGLPDDAPDAAADAARGTRRPYGNPAISGVPFFVFNGTHALSGAASAESLLETMLHAARGPAR